MALSDDLFAELRPGASLDQVVEIGRAYIADEGDIPAMVMTALVMSCEDDGATDALEALRTEHFKSIGEEPPSEPVLE